MTREEAIKLLNKWGVLLPPEADEALDMAIEALNCSEIPNGSTLKNLTKPNKNCEVDLISRQAALEYFMTNTNWHDEDGDPIEDWDDKRKLLEDYFNGIPSATCKDCIWHECNYNKVEWNSEPKAGQWKLVDHMRQCDQCQYRQKDQPTTNFCPSCGAWMRW